MTNKAYNPQTNPSMQLGSKGQSVASAQKFLNAIRINHFTQLRKLRINGIFDPIMQENVRIFQSLTNLPPTGKIDIITWNTLKQYSSANQAVNPPYPGTVLKIGSTGTNVSRMQEYLNVINNYYYSNQNLTLKVDGIYGSQTAQVVMQYQALNELSIDGEIGEQTWNSIVLKYNDISGGGGERVWPGYNITYGTTGSDVEYMQTLLNVIQGFYDGIIKLSVDGIFGNNSAIATTQFQEQFQLSSNGIIDETTWNNIVKVAGLVTLQKYPDVITQYPGYVLQVGATGDYVRFLQSYLNRINSYYSYGWPTLTIDGKYGSNCYSVVMMFQASAGCAVDGKVGPETWNALIPTYNNTLNGDTPIVNPPYPGTVLTIGSTGTNVARMQEYLNAINYYYYPYQFPVLQVDGNYGTDTAQAVMNYQALNGLTIDGEIGEQTWNSIVLKYNDISGGGERVWPGYNITYGVTGSDVQYMQTLLDLIQTFYDGIISITIDGNFGSNTEEATRQFQEQFENDNDGIIGEQTWNAIVRVAALVKVQNYPDVLTQYPGYILQVGSSGDYVRFIQSYLNRINSTNEYGWSILKIDGIFGSITRTVVMQFQSVSGNTPDGKVGQQTWRSLIPAYNNTLI